MNNSLDFSIIDNLNNIVADALKKAVMIPLRKAKENCPIQTGTLRRSIASSTQVTTDGAEATIFTNVEYAPYVEVGTKFKDANPFLERAVEESKQEILQQFSEILGA